MNYHIRISLEDERHGEYESDLEKDDLMQRFVSKYRQGEPIVINGRTIHPDEIKRIRIYKSEDPIQKYIDEVKAEHRRSSVTFLGGPTSEWEAIGKTTEITEKLITAPAGYESEDRDNEREVESETQVSSEDKVFIVHGHDHELKSELEAFLSTHDIDSIVLHRKPDSGQTIIEKFENHSDVEFAFILLTPDDIAFSKEEYESLRDEDEENPKGSYRARQNVLFEAGFFVGRIGRPNVCLIYVEGVDIPSDFSGLIYQELEEGESIEDIGYHLIRELRSAGIEVDWSDS